MKPLLTCGVVCQVVVQLVVLGCGGAPQPQKPAAQAVETIQVGGLPQLGQRMPPLDDGRIEVAPPSGWHVPSRSARWVVRFQETTGSSYPSIIVRAEDYEDLSSVCEENVHEFAEQLAATVKQGESPSGRIGSLRPVRIGSLVGVGQESRGIAPYHGKKIPVQRFAVYTVVAGRKYTIELQAREGDLDKYRPYLLAVAGGMKFPKAAATQPQQPKTPKPDAEYQEEL